MLATACTIASSQDTSNLPSAPCLLVDLLLSCVKNIFSDTNHATISTPSGTSALQLLAVHLANDYKGNKVVYMPNRTWFVHESIFKETGIETQGYRYFDPASYKFDFSHVCEDMLRMPKESMILFHACAHVSMISGINCQLVEQKYNASCKRLNFVLSLFSTRTRRESTLRKNSGKKYQPSLKDAKF